MKLCCVNEGRARIRWTERKTITIQFSLVNSLIEVHSLQRKLPQLCFVCPESIFGESVIFCLLYYSIGVVCVCVFFSFAVSCATIQNGSAARDHVLSEHGNWSTILNGKSVIWNRITVLHSILVVDCSDFQWDRKRTQILLNICRLFFVLLLLLLCRLWARAIH